MMAELIPDLVQYDTIYALASSNSRLYAARHSGLYRSIDGGQVWENCLKRLEVEQPLTITSVAVHNDTIFAGTKGAIFCSYDAGQSWTIVGLASPPPEVVALAISPNFAEDGMAVAGTTDDGIFVSMDRGTSWVAWNFGLIDTHVFAVAFSPLYADERIIFAGTESGIFVSKNGGRGWIETDFPMDAAPVISLAISPVGLIYAGTESHGLWTSHNRGTTWQRIAGDEITGSINAILFRQHSASEVCILLEDKVLLSSDHGRIWRPYSVDIPDGKVGMTMSASPTNPLAFMLGFSDGTFLSVT